MKFQNCNLSLQIAQNCIKLALKFTRMRWRLGLHSIPLTWELKTPQRRTGTNGTPPDIRQGLFPWTPLGVSQ